MSRSKWNRYSVVCLLSVICLAALPMGCLRARGRVIVQGEVDVPLPPPPPIILPPVPTVVYSSDVGCDYVSGVDYDVFYVDGYFYTHHHDRWYSTHRPGAAWIVVPPPHIPPLFIPGPPRPGWHRVAGGPPRPVTTFRTGLPFPVPPPPPPVPGRSVGPARREKPSGTVRPSSPGRIAKPEPTSAERPKPGRRVGPESPGRITKPEPTSAEKPKPGRRVGPESPGRITKPEPSSPEKPPAPGSTKPSVRTNVERPTSPGKGQPSAPPSTSVSPGRSAPKPKDTPKPEDEPKSSSSSKGSSSGSKKPKR